jgi:hypothetical protein
MLTLHRDEWRNLTLCGVRRIYGRTLELPRVLRQDPQMF